MEKSYRGERKNQIKSKTAEINQSRIILFRQAQLELFPNEYILMSLS